jgi:DMSO/TMAO reductase YedYZ molybdopterin-dependent catalytic subunit
VTEAVTAAERLPPGQTPTRKFPVVGEAAPAPEALDLASWRLVVDGLVEEPLVYTYDELRALPAEELVADIHCVTGWSRFASRFTGLPLDRLLDRARPLAAARFVRFAAYSPRGHDTTLPLDLAAADTWLVWAADGAPLTVEHGYPLRTVTPSRYFYKSLKWLRRVELLAEDRPGYWERESSYHNTGDPWAGDQRFASGSLSPARLAAFRAARDFRPWRGPRKVLLGVDLRGWRPASRDLRELQLKNCDLRHAELRGVDLRGANLSLSDLRGADLRDTDLRGADVEGADLRGADLGGADLGGAHCTATRLAGAYGGRETRLAGSRWHGVQGLLEGETDFLARSGGGRR